MNSIAKLPASTSTSISEQSVDHYRPHAAEGIDPLAIYYDEDATNLGEVPEADKWWRVNGSDRVECIAGALEDRTLVLTLRYRLMMIRELTRITESGFGVALRFEGDHTRRQQWLFEMEAVRMGVAMAEKEAGLWTQAQLIELAHLPVLLARDITKEGDRLKVEGFSRQDSSDRFVISMLLMAWDDVPKVGPLDYDDETQVAFSQEVYAAYARSRG